MEHDGPAPPDRAATGLASDEESVARLLRAAGLRPAAPPDAAARVRAAAYTSWETAVQNRRRRRFRFAAAAAAAFAAAAIGALFVWRNPARTRPASASPEIAVVAAASGEVHALSTPAMRLAIGSAIFSGGGVETGAGGRAALRLGGASVRLDHGTRLTFDSATTLSLGKGAVYVDSGGKGAAFEVRAGAGVARDLGTQFEVRLEGGVTRIRVREGAVAWEQRGTSERATAGSQIDVDPRGAVRRAAVSPHGPEWGWVQDVAPAFELEGRSVRQFLDWVSRETGFRVRLEGADASGKADAVVLHGSSAGMTPEEALSAVLPTCGLAHRIENGHIVVSPEPKGRNR